MKGSLKSSLVLAGLAAACLLCPALRAGEAPAPTYNRDIRPILAENCFACHGPDAGARKAGLRLDRRDAAVKKGALVPGDTDKSELIHRIFWDEPSKVMPPPRTKKTLTDRQKDLLKRWVAAGAEYQTHWAYLPSVRTDPPAVKDEKWVRNPIDRFILARLEREGLTHSPEADRETLIRRVSLDLTGLPPTPEEVDAFVADRSPDAYEKVVDRLLAEDAFGEHWARTWLDLARYGDSAGYANDPPRTIWLYRDYVIRSFNQDKPFDQFTIEQIAGDLLPHPTDDQLIATAFHRNTMTNSEGGTRPEEFRNAAIIDRVNTTMTVWMGTSIACCQCHDHKYDPLTNKEYFQLFAIFNNTADANRADESPLLSFYTDGQKAKRAELVAEVAAVEAQFKEKAPALAAGQAAWEREAAAGPPEWTVLSPDAAESSGGATLTKQPDGAVLAGGANPAKDVFTITAKTDLKHITGFRLEALADSSLPSKGPGRAGNFVLTAFKVKAAQAEKRFSSAAADFEQQGFPVAAAIAGKGGDAGWAVAPQTGKDHTAVFALEAPIDQDGPVALTFTLEQSSQYAQHVLGKFRLSAMSAKNPLGRPKLPDNVRAALAVVADQRTAPQRDLLADYYAHNVAPELAAEHAPARRAEKAARRGRPRYGSDPARAGRRPAPQDAHRNPRQLPGARRRGERGRPRRLLSGQGRHAARPSRAGALARGPEQPADGARPGEPLLGEYLRDRHRAHQRGVRLAGRASRPSRIAGLAGHGDSTTEVGHEEVPQAPRHVRDVSAVVARHAGAARARSGQPPAGAGAALPPERRNGARPGAGRERPAQPQDVRAPGETAAARARPQRGLRRRPGLADERRRGPLPPRPLHGMAPLQSLPVAGDLRRAQP